jgi:hypothetical protein
VEVREGHAGFSERIEVRGLYFASKPSDVRPSHVIDHDKQKVGLPICHFGLRLKWHQHEHQNGNERHHFSLHLYRLYPGATFLFEWMAVAAVHRDTRPLKRRSLKEFAMP